MARALTLICLSLAVLLGSGCSLVYDFTECSSDNDCAGLSTSAGSSYSCRNSKCELVASNDTGGGDTGGGDTGGNDTSMPDTGTPDTADTADTADGADSGDQAEVVSSACTLNSECQTRFGADSRVSA